MGTARRISTAILALVLSACARKPADATPEGVVRELLDRIDRSLADPAEMHGVYELMSSSTKANLIERARRASTTSGREVSPEEMIAPGLFLLRFEPRRMLTRFGDEGAIVDVVGIDPEKDRAEVPCVLEDDRWRIEIRLPQLAPMDRRPETG
jgi:hypothetical protein